MKRRHRRAAKLWRQSIIALRPVRVSAWRDSVDDAVECQHRHCVASACRYINVSVEYLKFAIVEIARIAISINSAIGGLRPRSCALAESESEAKSRRLLGANRPPWRVNAVL